MVQRRAAHAAFSTAAWRRRMADGTAYASHPEPSVSVVLATKRPEMLAFALRQVAQAARRRPPAGAGSARLHARTPTCCASSGPSTLVVRPHDESALFGDVLADAVAAADGDLVLKMDDDDWYGPDFVADLLLARAYSGAEMVGTPAEMHYLVERTSPSVGATGPSSTPASSPAGPCWSSAACSARSAASARSGASSTPS